MFDIAGFDLFQDSQVETKPVKLPELKETKEETTREVIKSISYDQFEILENIKTLYLNGDNFQADLTYGNGAFYRKSSSPELCFDIEPLSDHVIEACSTSVPVKDESIKSVVFDPPFLTYVRAARKGNGSMIMAGRFSGYWAYTELEEHYRKTLKEVGRILEKKGIIVFKCQDIIHNHRMHCTHVNVINWALEHGLTLKDLFVLNAKRRLPAPNRKGKQKHARVFHSYFLVLEKR